MTIKTGPASARVHDLIRLDILEGQWAPGAKLSAAGLGRRYETSTTVIRESLTRLAGERLVASEPNRGFFVQRLTPRELGDVTELRCRIEAFGVELSIARGDLIWESELIAAHHLMSRVPRRDEERQTVISREWERAHRAFHAQVLVACGVPTLAETARELSDVIEVYRHRAAASEPAVEREVEREHEEILAAMIDRDAAAAARLLRRHYEATLKVVLAATAPSAAG